MFSRALTLFFFVSCALVAQGTASSNFIVRRGVAPTAKSGRHLHFTKRAPSRDELAQASPTNAKREIKARADGGIVIPLHVKHTRREARHGERVVGFSRPASAQKPKDDNNGGGGNDGDGGADPPADPPAGTNTNTTFILDRDYALNVTLDGIETSILVDGTNNLLSPGPDAYGSPYDAPAASDTGLTWKHLMFGGKVHKADFSFGDGAYSFKDVAYGDQTDSPKFEGGFGIGFPSASHFPAGAPRSIAEALTTDYNITSFSVVVLDSSELLLGVDPYVDVNPKALFGQVPAETNGWFAKGTFNGTEIIADFSPQNTHVYGDADEIQKFFGDQQPTKRGKDNPSNYYDVPCDGGPVIEFAFGDTSKNGSGFTITFSEQATLFTDKASSTGCSSILVGQTPDPERFETSWSLGFSFQFHLTPSYVFADPKAPVINFFDRPESLGSH